MKSSSPCVQGQLEIDPTTYPKVLSSACLELLRQSLTANSCASPVAPLLIKNLIIEQSTARYAALEPCMEMSAPWAWFLEGSAFAGSSQAPVVSWAACCSPASAAGTSVPMALTSAPSVLFAPYPILPLALLLRRSPASVADANAPERSPPSTPPPPQLPLCLDSPLPVLASRALFQASPVPPVS